MSIVSRENTDTVLQEINLGAHYLFIMSDQRIELLTDEQASSGAVYVLSLDSTETYRLLISLQEVFKQGMEQSCIPEERAGASWDPAQGDRRSRKL